MSRYPIAHDALRKWGESVLRAIDGAVPSGYSSETSLTHAITYGIPRGGEFQSRELVKHFGRMAMLAAHALEKLKRSNETAAHTVMIHYLAGGNIDERANSMGVNIRTYKHRLGQGHAYVQGYIEAAGSGH